MGKLLGGAARYEREEAAALAAFEAEQHRHAMADAERRRHLAGLRAADDQAAATALGATQNHNASVDQFERDFLAREPKPSRPPSAILHGHSTTDLATGHTPDRAPTGPSRSKAPPGRLHDPGLTVTLR